MRFAPGCTNDFLNQTGGSMRTRHFLPSKIPSLRRLSTIQGNIQKGGTMALHIKMKDGEKVVVNGAVFVSQGNSHVVLENRASVLHSREVMSPEEATTNARKLYFACMLAYIDQSNVEQYRDRIPVLLRDLVEMFVDTEAKATCVRVATLIATNEYYQSLAECRQLIKYEDDRLCELVNEAA